MTSRTTIDRLLRGAKAERIGLFDRMWHETLARWMGEGYPTVRGEDGAEQPVDPIDHFGFDMCLVGGWFDILPLRGVEETVAETDEWVARRNGAGAVLKYWKHRSGTPEHLEFRMTSREIWERDYRPHVLQVDRERLDIEGNARELARRREQGLWTYYEHYFVWENMRQSMGDVCMYESLLLDPGWIRDYNQVYTDFFKAHYALLFAEAGFPDGIWVSDDLGYSNGLFCSPRVLADLIFPYYRELVDFFHAHGLPVIFHSCGGVEEALPLIVEAGFDGLNPLEVKAGCDPLRFAAKYGDKLVFTGGFDVRILESGDRPAIEREVTRLTEGMKDLGARYVFGSDHSISPRVAYADFLFALDVFREHMAY